MDNCAILDSREANLVASSDVSPTEEGIPGILYIPVFRIEGKISPVTHRRKSWAPGLRERIITVYRPGSLRTIKALTCFISPVKSITESLVLTLFTNSWRPGKIVQLTPINKLAIFAINSPPINDTRSSFFPGRSQFFSGRS